MMKKWIVHIVYIMIITFFFVFAKIKVAENQKYKVMAETAAETAMQAQQEAERTSQIAQREADLARMEAARAMESMAEVVRLMELLEKCQKK
ncbi:MAG: hypothetical protein RIA69_18275 [Cyclobacteriaceae bacterium]